MGNIALDEGSSFTMLNSGLPVAVAWTQGVGYEVSRPGTSGVISVETIGWPNSTFGLGSSADRMEPTTVAGASGWILTRDDGSDEEPWRGLAWSVGGGTIFVSGHVAEAELRALADHLEVVDADAWFDALPYAPWVEGESPCTSAATC